MKDDSSNVESYSYDRLAGNYFTILSGPARRIIILLAAIAALIITAFIIIERGI